jgi:hypothetical protein
MFEKNHQNKSSWKTLNIKTAKIPLNFFKHSKKLQNNFVKIKLKFHRRKSHKFVPKYTKQKDSSSDLFSNGFIGKVLCGMYFNVVFIDFVKCLQFPIYFQFNFIPTTFLKIEGKRTCSNEIKNFSQMGKIHWKK